MDSQTKCQTLDKTLNSLRTLEEIACYYSHRYRFDPFVKGIHDTYIESIKSILEAAKGEDHVH